MVVPYPFTRALFLYGEPIVVPRDGNVEEWRAEIERRMNALAEEAEQRHAEQERREQGHHREVRERPGVVGHLVRAEVRERALEDPEEGGAPGA